MSSPLAASQTRVVTASEDNTARVWDAASGELIARLVGPPWVGHEGRVYSAAFSPDATRVVTASSDKTARVWDAASGDSSSVWTATRIGLLGRLQPRRHPRGDRPLRQNRAGLDAASGELIARLEGHEYRVWSAAFSTDATRVVTASAD